MRVILHIRYRTLLKFFLFTALTVVVAFGSAFVYFYTEYSRLVDREVLSRPWRPPPQIRSAPGKVFVGQAISPEDLASFLLRRGYAKAEKGVEPPCFQVDAGRKSVSFATDSDVRPPRAERFRVEFGDNGPSAIYRLSNGRETPVGEAELRPALLSAKTGVASRIPVAFDQIPLQLRQAVLAAEDRRFFAHPGLDVWGIARSMLKNLSTGAVVEGGSTITQQLVKNIFLTPERTFSRKLKEAFISLILESRLSKKQLFEIYVDTTYLGQAQACEVQGFAQAAAAFCRKDIRTLSLPECAMLAGMIRSPNSCNPFRNPRRCKERRDQILAAMESAGFVTPSQRAAASGEPLPSPSDGLFSQSLATCFLDYLSDRMGRFSSGERRDAPSRVDTTLNLELQGAAEQGLQEGLARVRNELARQFPSEPAGAVQGAIVVLDPGKGSILAMVGGSDYAKSQFNRAAYAFRQAGSVLKPFLYAFMLDGGAGNGGRGLTCSSVVEDRPLSIRLDRRDYRPQNYRGVYMGPVTMKTALAHSLNAATMLFAQEIGFRKLADDVNGLGFSGRASPFPSVALGTVDASPLEMASAYTAFYNGGRVLAPVAAVSGGPPATWHPPVFSPRAAYIVADMMLAVVREGTAKALVDMGLDLPTAAKTGTAKDGWFVGMTGNLLCCAWVGYDSNRELPLSGGKSALYVFAEFLRRARSVYPVRPFQTARPTGLETRVVCRLSGLLAKPGCPETETDHFFSENTPLASCHYH